MNARSPRRSLTSSLLSLSLAGLIAAFLGRPGLTREPGDIFDDPIDWPIPPRADPAIMKLTLHPKAQELLDGVMQGLSQKRINVALIGGEKFMIADCLGLKVSAGEFELELGYSTFSMGTWGVEFVFTIDHISVSALKFRMQPRANLIDPCDWSSAFNVGGSVNDIRIVVRFDPRIHLDDCYMVSLGTFEARVSIGGVNLSNVQNDLERAAKNLIEDALTNALNLTLPSILSQAINGSFLNGICMTKLAIYEAYMAFLGTGVALYGLPEKYISGLQPFYPHVDLRAVKFGHSDRQPPNNTTTDCNRIYFSSYGYMDRLRNGALESDDWDLLFHELQHTEQCAQLGGRVEFAKKWFHDFEISALVLNLSNPSTYFEQLHDNMPMEQDAFDAEERIGVFTGTVREPVSEAAAPGIEVSAVAGADRVAYSVSDGSGGFLLFVYAGTYDLHVRRVEAGELESTLAKDDVDVSGSEERSVLLYLPAPATTPAATFVRGDANRSGSINISDALAILNWLFSGGAPPHCLDAADVTDDGTVNIADPLALLNHLFGGAAPPALPFPMPGSDPTADALSCGDAA